MSGDTKRVLEVNQIDNLQGSTQRVKQETTLNNLRGITQRVYVVGGGSAPVIDELNVTPTTSAQTITAPEGTDGYSPVNVSAVTSAIDANITAGNIKKDVSILGVTGTYEGGGATKYGATASTFLGDVDANGVLQNADEPTNLTFTGVKSINQISPNTGIFLRRFQNLQSIREVLFPDLTQFLNNSTGIMTNCFRGSSITKLLCPKVITARQNAFAYICYGCTELVEINFDLLPQISYENYVFQGAFGMCTKLKSARFPSLISCTGNKCFDTAFDSSGIKNLYFYFRPDSSLASDIFNNMLLNVTGCTIHVPSNLSGTTVLSSLSGYPNFGGTSTVIAYDLPKMLRLNNTYIRCVINDTATSYSWKNQSGETTTWVYTLSEDPSVGDTLYSDSACTTPLYTINSIS